MKKLWMQSLVIAALIGLFVPIALAQNGRERIRFAKGANSVVLKRTLIANSGVITFIVKAKKGQMLNFTVEGSKKINVSLSVQGEQDVAIQSETGEPNEFKVAKSVDHYVTVVNGTGKKANITLRLNLMN